MCSAWMGRPISRRSGADGGHRHSMLQSGAAIPATALLLELLPTDSRRSGQERSGSRGAG